MPAHRGMSRAAGISVCRSGEIGKRIRDARILQVRCLSPAFQLHEGRYHEESRNAHAVCSPERRSCLRGHVGRPSVISQFPCKGSTATVLPRTLVEGQRDIGRVVVVTHLDGMAWAFDPLHCNCRMRVTPRQHGVQRKLKLSADSHRQPAKGPSHSPVAGLCAFWIHVLCCASFRGHFRRTTGSR